MPACRLSKRKEPSDETVSDLVTPRDVSTTSTTVPADAPEPEPLMEPPDCCESAEVANYDAEILNQMPSCYAGWSFARILATGEVNSCLKSFKMPVGNIFESSFPEIWQNEKQEEYILIYNMKK